MITNLLLKYSSNAKTAKLMLTAKGEKSSDKAVRNESVLPGTYVFEQVINIHHSQQFVQEVVGSKVLVFRRRGTPFKVYVYAKTRAVLPLLDSVSVSNAYFRKLCAGAVRGVTSLEVKSTFFLWGAERLTEQPLPSNQRYMLTLPLDAYEEPSEEFKKRERELLEAKRRAEAAAAAEQVAERERQRQAEAKRQREKAEKESAQRVQLKKATPSQPPRRPATVSSRTAPKRGLSSTGRSSYTQIDNDDDDSLADFMFMSMFPDVAPIYRPNSFMAWYLWSQNQHDHNQQPFAGAGGQFDGGGASGDWGPVPGFPEAVSQRVTPYGESQRVELLDSNGASVGSFIVTQNNGTTQFTAPGGHVFTVAGDSAPTIEYANDSGQRFSWDGANEPVIGAVQDTDDAPQSFAEPGALDFGAEGNNDQSSGSSNSRFDVDTSAVNGNVSTPDDSSTVALQSDTSY